MPDALAHIGLLLCAPLALGALIKAADDLHDRAELRAHRPVAIPLVLVAAALLVAMAWFDNDTVVIVISVLIALALAKKLDNPAFWLFATLTVAGLAGGALAGRVDVLVRARTLGFWIALVLIVALGVVDEVGNDRCERGTHRGFWFHFFRWRFSLKLGLPLMALCAHGPLGLGAWEVAAFWMFDLGYLVGDVTMNRVVRRLHAAPDPLA